ncbi:MAG: hypothetical protein ACKO6N_17770 [Myxococcota bacterium]
MNNSYQTSTKFCHHCKREVPYDTRILRTETCPWCRADLHVCLNCKFHNASMYNECELNGTERVRERDRANHCSDFAFRDGVKGEDKTKEAAINKLNNLFKF